MKLIHVALTSEGYEVLEAADGRTALDRAGAAPPPDLILQDLKLPDLDGIELLRRLRSLPGVDAVPILALSGSHSRMEGARVLRAGFNDFLLKPVEPSQLLRVVKGYLQPLTSASGHGGEARRILVVDDDPVQLKLAELHLARAGFAVSTATDGLEALEVARRLTPAAVVSDVLMPGLDGFRLCTALKQDPRLAGIPVVLTSAAFTEPADVDLARQVGASALVNRSADQQEMIRAVLASLDDSPVSQPVVPAALPTEIYTGRIAHQLERQSQVVNQLTNRLALLQAEIGILSATAEAIKANEPREAVLGDLLQICLNAGGFSRGAIYLEEDHRLTLTAQFGYADPTGGMLADFFGHPNLLRAASLAESPMIVPGPGLPATHAEALLAQAGVKTIVLNPIKLGGARLGAFWMGSDQGVSEAEVRPFAEGISAQLAQAVTLTRSFANAGEAEREYREVFDNAVEGFFQVGLEDRIVNANPALARILGYGSVAGLMAAAPELPAMFVDPARAAEIELCLREAKQLVGFEGIVRRQDGAIIWISLNGRAVRDGAGALRYYLGSFEDITEQLRVRELNQQEETHRRQSQLKEQFLSVVSHELRTPVAAIHQFATILMDGLAGDLSSEQQEHLTVILRNVDYLRTMIEDLLEATRVDRPALTIRLDRVSISEVISQVIGALRLNALAKRVTLLLEVPADLPSVYADGSCVGHILTNLIGNAIKFTPAEGTVTFRAQVVATGPRIVRIEVADTGCGIAAEETMKIFDYLYQGTNVQDHSRKGFGIGLHVCRDLVRRQGGTISVESTIGRGSTFRFTLPVQELAGMEVAV